MTAQSSSVTEILRRKGYDDFPRINAADLEGYFEPGSPTQIVFIGELGREIMQALTGEEKRTGAQLPWYDHDKDIRFRAAELSVWAGTNGHGKTTLVTHCAVDWVDQGERVLIASVEMSPVTMGAMIVRQICGTENPTREYVTEALVWVAKRIMFLDHRGNTPEKLLLAAGRYCAEKWKTSQYIVDNLTKVTGAEDDYNGQKRIVGALSDLALETKMHLHLIAHTRKGEDENRAPGKFDIRGSSTITDLADNVLTLWRNRRAPEDRQEGEPDAVLQVVKQRHGTGWEGKFRLWYDPRSKRFRGEKIARPTEYVKFSMGSPDRVAD